MNNTRGRITYKKYIYFITKALRIRNGESFLKINSFSLIFFKNFLLDEMILKFQNSILIILKKKQQKKIQSNEIIIL